MGGLLTVDHRHPTPLYAQLEQGIRGAIGAGRLPPGAQLPTVRQLAVELKVNANTVARVYADLERSGILETRRGVGSFIRASAAEARSPDEHLRRLRAFVTRVLADASAAGFTPDELIEHIAFHRKEGA